MKKEKKANNHRSLLRKKGIALLVIAIIFIIGSIFFTRQSYDANLITNNKSTIKITIPESYFNFVGSEIDEEIESLKELGNEYFTSVKKVNNAMIIEITENQREKLIERNNEFIETLLKDFSNANKKYRYEVNSDFSELTYYFDENISSTLEFKTILGVTSSYIFNNILRTNNQDWQIHIKIINCHTNKIVAEGTLPKDTIQYGELEWSNSY